jgi:hypothetical protein
MSQNIDNLPRADQNGTEPENDYRLVVKFGCDILQAGHTAVPNLLLDLYTQLGLTTQEMLFVIHLMQFQWSKRNPYPALTTIAEKMGVKRRMIGNYVKSLKRKAYNCPHTNGQPCDCPNYLVVTERFDLERGQLSNIYDLSNLLFATVTLARDKGMLPQDETPRQQSAGGGRQNVARGGRQNLATEEDERSKKTKFEQDKETFRKGAALQTQKGGGGGESKGTDSHRAAGTIGNPPTQNAKGNEQTTRGSQSAKSETLNAVLTTNTRPRRPGRDQAEREPSGVSLEHLDILNRQYGSRPAEQNGNRTPGSPRQGNWKQAPLFIQGTIGDWFSLELHDQATNSTITRVHRIYQAWQTQHPELDHEQIQDEFYQLMQTARTKAKHATITTLTPTGQPNRTPFFLACLADLSGLNQDG